MIQALEHQARTADSERLTFEERLGHLVDLEITTRENRRIRSRLKNAKLTHAPSIEDFDTKGRGIDRNVLTALSSSEWVRRKQNILIDGKTGVGKSHLACALAQKACRDGFTVHCDRVSRLFNEFAIAKADGRYGTLLASLAKKDVLVLDDFGLFMLNDDQRQDLLEVLEDRYSKRSTIVTSQIPSEHWHDLIGDPTIADAVLDRLVHNAHKIHLKGESKRKEKSSDSQLTG